MTTHTILGVSFFTGTVEAVVATGLRGGLVVIPSAPVLVRMPEDAAHRAALLDADLAITDSGLMVLLWRLFNGVKLERVSGLEYLKLLLEELASGSQPVAARNVLWVMPTEVARDRNLSWLQANGYATTINDCYVAPKYPTSGLLQDEVLLSMVRERRPSHIILTVGGGVQERLGDFLKRALENELPIPSSQPSTSGTKHMPPSFYRPGIHCVGAAIGFLTGEQVRIPMWADYFYLGWLFRCVSAPRRFVPRYWKAARLIGLMWRYGAEAPPVKRF